MPTEPANMKLLLSGLRGRNDAAVNALITRRSSVRIRPPRPRSFGRSEAFASGLFCFCCFAPGVRAWASRRIHFTRRSFGNCGQREE